MSGETVTYSLETVLKDIKDSVKDVSQKIDNLQRDVNQKFDKIVDILAAVKRTAIPKPHDLGFCFFPEGFFAPALTDLLCSGLMVALQTDTASPAAKMFLLALTSRSWCVPQSGQSHSRIFNGIFKGNIPAITTPFRARKPSI